MAHSRRTSGSGDLKNDELAYKAFSEAFELTRKGNDYGERGKFSKAKKCFEKAISVKSDHVPAYLGLSTVYREQGEFDQALKVLESSPSRAKTWKDMTDWDFTFDIAFQKAKNNSPYPQIATR